jgi:CheY-like chemotaxis protein
MATVQSMRIDVADSSEEGRALADALRERGFTVRCVAPAEVASAGGLALVVLAGDDDHTLSILDALRQDPRTALVPVILTGVPASGPEDPDTLRRLGADAVYPRPVPIARIVRRAETYLTPAESLRRDLSLPPTAPGAGNPSPVPPPRPSTAPVPTLALPTDLDSWHVDDAGPERAPGGATAVGMSARVMALLREADERLFPDAPRADFSFVDPGPLLEGLLQDGLMEPEPLPEDLPAAPVEGDAMDGMDGPSVESSLADATTAAARGTRRRSPPDERSGVTALGDRLDPLVRGPLANEVPALVVLGARHRFDTRDALERLGGQGIVRLAPDASGRMARLDLQPEVLAWLERHDGEALDRVLRDEAPGGGGPGLIIALAVLEVLSVHHWEGTGAQRVEGRAAMRGRIAAAQALAEEGDYFSILGVPRDAGAGEVAAAHETRRRELLAAGPLEGGLAQAQREALAALDEAHRILSVDRLRRAYRSALDALDVPA